VFLFARWLSVVTSFTIAWPACRGVGARAGLRYQAADGGTRSGDRVLNPELVPWADALAPPRSVASRHDAGIPFAPEKDGRTFLSGAFHGADRDRSARY
jgi:hypothetical protein